jgi:hypothetical protein
MRAPRPCAEPPRAVSLATFRALRSVGESDGSDAIGPTVTSGWASAFSGSPNSHSKLAGPIPRLSGVIAGAGGAAAVSGERASCTGDAAAGSGEGATCTGGAAGSGGRATCTGRAASGSGARATVIDGADTGRLGSKGE